MCTYLNLKVRLIKANVLISLQNSQAARSALGQRWNSSSNSMNFIGPSLILTVFCIEGENYVVRTDSTFFTQMYSVKQNLTQFSTKWLNMFLLLTILCKKCDWKNEQRTSHSFQFSNWNHPWNVYKLQIYKPFIYVCKFHSYEKIMSFNISQVILNVEILRLRLYVFLVAYKLASQLYIW